MSKYAPEMIMIEEEKCRKFEDGLNHYIRAHVTGFCHDDFSNIETCALHVERVKKEEYERKERRQGKKNPGQSSSYQHQNKKFRGPQGSSQPITQGPAQITSSKTILSTQSVTSALGGSSRGLAPSYCTHYGMRHKGEGWRLTGACLACGSNEHKIKIVLELVSSHYPGLGVQFQQYRRATRTTRVLHHQVHRDKQHRLWVDRMLVLRLEHMQ